MGALFRRWLGAIVCGVSVLSLAAPADAAETNWRAIAEGDLQFIHDTLREAHPGYIDQSAAGEAFRVWLEEGLRESLKWAQRVRSRSEVEAVLRFYGSGFRDGHLGVGTDTDLAQSDWRTTGWLVVWRNGGYFVSQHLPGKKANLPPIGSRVLSCDGLAPAKLLERDIAPFFDRRVELESVAGRLANLLTLRSEALTPWAKPMKHCVLALPTNESRSYRLQWRKLDAMPDGANEGAERPTMGIVELGKGRLWVHASNFMLDSKDLEDYRSMLARLRALREAQLVVFDLRGNTGGDASLGTALLEASLGADAVAHYLQRSAQGRAYAEYRVSPVALKVFSEQYIPMIKQLHGEKSDRYTEISHQRDRMQDALAQGKAWLRQSWVEPQRESERPEPKLTGPRLVVVTDAHCASACLDFVDTAKALPGIRHLGRSTSADTVFLENGFARLPSGVGRLYFPFKIWRERQRGNNEPYVPDEVFPGDIGDTAAVRKWVLERMGERTGMPDTATRASR